MAMKPVAGAQTRDQRVEEPRAPGMCSDLVQACFGAQRARQALERLIDGRAVEGSEAGFAPRLGEQFARIQQLLGAHGGLPAKCFAACQAKVMAGPRVEPGPG